MQLGNWHVDCLRRSKQQQARAGLRLLSLSATRRRPVQPPQLKQPELMPWLALCARLNRPVTNYKGLRLKMRPFVSFFLTWLWTSKQHSHASTRWPPQCQLPWHAQHHSHCCLPRQSHQLHLQQLLHHLKPRPQQQQHLHKLPCLLHHRRRWNLLFSRTALGQLQPMLGLPWSGHPQQPQHLW